MTQLNMATHPAQRRVHLHKHREAPGRPPGSPRFPPSVPPWRDAHPASQAIPWPAPEMKEQR